MSKIQRFRMPIDVNALPGKTGSYALLIRLTRRLRDEIGALGKIELPAGDYLYLGSAYGPGGLRARLRRHLRAEKRRHWHVDYLTGSGEIIEIVAVPGGRECDLVARLLACRGVSIPVAGFGSSDCRRCRAHLLALSGQQASLVAALAG